MKKRPKPAQQASDSPENVADRPHRLTLLIGIMSPSLALVALIVSLVSVNIAQTSMQIGQRAYLTYEFRMDEYKDEPLRPMDEQVTLQGEVEIKNLGNTPAYDIDVTLAPPTKSSFALTPMSGRIISIGPHASRPFPMRITSTRSGYRGAMFFDNAGLRFEGSIICRDVFGETHKESQWFSTLIRRQIVGNPDFFKQLPLLK